MDEALDIALRVATALEAAHENGVIHRHRGGGNGRTAPRAPTQETGEKNPAGERESGRHCRQRFGGHLPCLLDSQCRRSPPLFEGTIQATEEAIVNAIVVARTMTGINGNTVHALPHDRLRAVLTKYNRLQP